MTSPTTILLTGGAGYIGSHTYVALVEAGYQPLILDDFSNSDPEVLQRLQQITGREVLCQRGNARDRATLEALLTQHQVQAVIHFAGFKAVGESVAQPLKYFENNLGSTIALLQAMAATGCQKVGVFQQRHGLRRPRIGADHRVVSAQPHQSLWPHQAGV